MLTDKEKLEKMRDELIGSGKDAYVQMKKKNVLDKLIAATNKETGKLSFPIIIPLYEHDGSFLKQIINSLQYFPSYKIGFNDYYRTTCYKITM